LINGRNFDGGRRRLARRAGRKAARARESESEQQAGQKLSPLLEEGQEKSRFLRGEGKQKVLSCQRKRFG